MPTNLLEDGGSKRLMPTNLLKDGRLMPTNLIRVYIHMKERFRVQKQLEGPHHERGAFPL